MNKQKPWGMHTIIDLGNCNPEYIRDQNVIKDYIDKTIVSLQMKPFGDSIIIKFGEDPLVTGYTFVQMIETSLISGHLVEHDNSAHIDVFSCKQYDVPQLLYFTKEFFQGETCKWNILQR